MWCVTIQPSALSIGRRILRAMLSSRMYCWGVMLTLISISMRGPSFYAYKFSFAPR